MGLADRLVDILLGEDEVSVSLQDKPRITMKDAEDILRDYGRLYAQNPHLEWIQKLTAEQIAGWSSYAYWPVLEQTAPGPHSQKEEDIYCFPKELFYRLGGRNMPKKTIGWMACHLKGSNAAEVFPGLIAEYTRRFNRDGDEATGYDKIQHFITSSALSIKYGAIFAASLSLFKEAVDTTRLRNSLYQSQRDLVADFQGIRFYYSMRRHER